MIRILILLIGVGCCHTVGWSQGKREKKDSPFKAGTPVIPVKNGNPAEKPEYLFLEGEKHFLLEDYARASEWFGRAAAVSPAAGIRFKQAESLMRSGRKEDQEKAASAIAEAIAADASNSDYFLLAAEIEGSRQKYSEAARYLETMISRIAGTEAYLFELSGYHQLAGNQVKAVEALEKAEKIMGIQQDITYRKVEILEELNRSEQAEAELRKLIATEPDDVRHALALADLLTRHGKVPKAIVHLEDYIKTGSEAGYARMVLAQLYLGSGRKVEAFALAELAMQDPGLDSETRIALMKSMMAEAEEGKQTDAGDAEKLLQLYRLLEQTEGSSSVVMMVGGDLHMALGNRKLAATAYRRALRSGAGEYQAWNNLFVLDMEAKQFDSLIIHTEEALESYPNIAAVWYFNGSGHLQRKQYADAAESLKQALKLNPETNLKVEILSLLGESYQGLRNYDKADAAFEAGLSLAPDDATLLNNFSYYLSLRRAKLDRAEELAERLVKKNPGIAAFTDTYAWVLFARGKYQEARRILEPVIQSGNYNATHLDHFGDILYMLGDTVEAIRHWEKALSMNSQNESLRKKILNRRLN